MLGPVSGYMLRGQFIIRSRRGKSNKPPTEKQQAHYQRVRMVNNLLQPVIEFVNVGFAYVATGKSQMAYGLASSYQHACSITGQYPDFTIDYSKARFSEGPMSTEGINASVILAAENYLEFTWTPDRSYAHSNDHVMLLAYAPSLNEAVYTLCGAKRSVGTDTLILPNDWKGISIETYLSFKAENSLLCTNSIYLKRLPL